MSDTPHWQAIWAIFAELFPGHDALRSREAQRVWYGKLADLSYPDAKRVLQDLRATSKHRWPIPKEVDGVRLRVLRDEADVVRSREQMAAEDREKARRAERARADREMADLATLLADVPEAEQWQHLRWALAKNPSLASGRKPGREGFTTGEKAAIAMRVRHGYGPDVDYQCRWSSERRSWGPWEAVKAKELALADELLAQLYQKPASLAVSCVSPSQTALGWGEKETQQEASQGKERETQFASAAQGGKRWRCPRY